MSLEHKELILLIKPSPVKTALLDIMTVFPTPSYHMTLPTVSYPQPLTPSPTPKHTHVSFLYLPFHNHTLPNYALSFDKVIQKVVPSIL
jgi:hypothetical protein